MSVMRVMQVAFYQVVDMVAMRDSFVAAILAVNVSGVVTGVVMVDRASVGVRCVHFEHVLIDMIPVHMVQVPVMQVIGVPVMIDRFVPAAWSVLVSVASMLLAFVHHHSSLDPNALPGADLEDELR
jgi:hypothetical protein